jgi:hypothetical protein
VLCGCCLREMALQEVAGECGTTLIVVPSNILVQVRRGPRRCWLAPTRLQSMCAPSACSPAM